MTTVAVIGATSGIAQSCLRLWAEQGVDLVLIARDAAKLRIASADLTARGAASVTTAEVDLGNAGGVERAVECVVENGPVDIVLIAFGVMPTQAESDEVPADAHAVLDITGTLNVLALHLSTLAMIEQGHGTVAVLGSVAGDRGRKSNYLYGAAKAMVATAAAGLQHRVAGTDVAVVLVKPGPTQTPMTDGLDAKGLAKPEVVAEQVLAGIESRTPVVYAPGKWQLIMLIVRSLPRRIFHKTDF